MILIAAAGAPLVAAEAQTSSIPPLKLVVPYSAGGTTDALARQLQRLLAEVMNRPVVVDNKPGGAGTIGTNFVAKAAPDGNTIVFGNQAPNAIVPAIRKTPYDPLNDLRPLTTVAVMPLALTVSAEKGPKTLRDFMDQARKPDARTNYGSSGTGSFAHLAAHEFFRRGQLNALHIPYKGGSDVVTALLSGDIQGSFITAMEATSQVQSRQLRFLAVTSPKRMPGLPEVPAVAEEIPGFDAVIWFAVFAPKGTSDAVAKELRHALVQAIHRPEFQSYLADRNAEARTSTPEELTKLVIHDMRLWGEVVRKAGISVD
jgi:tripartite-type tricarboxylate transporter receptor subunit TctC